MRSAGEMAVCAAQETGGWTFLDEAEPLEGPADLDAALGPDSAVRDGWPRSLRPGTLEWIKTAETAPTRDKHIADIVTSAAQGLGPSPFRR